MAYNSSRPLTQKELAEIIKDLSDLEADDNSDISEEDKVIEDFKNNFESDSDEEEDFNLLLFRLQQKLETVCRSDTAGTSSSLVNKN
ncbi:hypothetical protein QE152_g1763 [Popillia japonica]|uniref:Uncharacterized protein n=1 Tax=Popillia japonica TaxID=7064 RepID=A0AAW1N1J7_POPJA